MLSIAFRNKDNAGFSLIELLVTITLLCILSAIAVTRLYSNQNEVGGGERLLEQAAKKISERRSEAIRLSGEDRHVLTVQLANDWILPISFKDIEQSSSLITEGDDNGDCLDDVTGTPVSCLVPAPGGEYGYVWNLACRDDKLEIPDNWKLVRTQSDLGGISLIGGGSLGRGIITTAFGFGRAGNANGYGVIFGTREGWIPPPGATSAGTLATSPFFAVYFVPKNGSSKTAVAVGVHPSGFIERFRYDGAKWLGYGNREL